MIGFTLDPRQVISTVCDADRNHKSDIARSIFTADEMEEIYYQAVVSDALRSLQEVHKRRSSRVDFY